jgi:hypothetical protein
MCRGAIGISIVAVLSLAGCGSSSDGPGGGVYSCNSPVEHSCVDLAAAPGGTFTIADVSILQVLCTAVPATWSSTAACPTSGRVGTCTFTTPAAELGISVPLATQARAYPPITAVDAAADCALIPGVWTAN